MKSQIIKNKSLRKLYKNKELNYTINSLILKNKILTPEFREICKIKLTENKPNYIIWENSPQITKIKNNCILTGRARALIQDYKVSRLMFKDYAESGWISGIKKV